MDERAYDVAIVGGGIVGLATAMELLRRHPNFRLVLVEKERDLAQHQTGRNSGVIHSGVYYTPGSLKAQLCVTGSRLMRQFCDEHGIAYNICGKVIVATEPDELPRLENLYERGQKNGVPGLEVIGPERLKEIEPYCVGIKALYSPQTGIVDYKQVAAAYAGEIERHGGVVRTGFEVEKIRKLSDGVLLESSAGDIQAKHLVTCAGQYSDKVAMMTAAPQDPAIVPFRGDYWVLRPERTYLAKGLIYPVPDPQLPFLGVHFTLRMDGSQWLGPNAVLAFAREGYRFGDVNPKELAETLAYPGFWRMAQQWWKTGLEEMYRDLSKAEFVRSLQRYVPDVQPDDVLPGPAGVRAQALSEDGKLVDDFILHHRENVIHVRNAPSPAATSSLAIARLIADTADRSFNLETSKSVTTGI
ncbi:MAG TPA: L-2-hydroxyglutarate oxidase [Chloroflexota bacterium]|nr:L-2-hydroxyglutarate oxidase [Chloroflexota bacterium]